MNAYSELLDACKRGDVSKVRDILDNEDITPNFVYQHQSPVIEAVQFGNLDVISVLKSHGAQLYNLPPKFYKLVGINFSPMSLAVMNSDLRTCQHLLSLGVDSRLRDPVNSPIYYACHLDDSSFLELFLNNSNSISDVCCSSPEELTVLELLCLRGKDNHLRWLVLNDYDLLEHDVNNRCTLLAIQGGNVDTLKYLLHNGIPKTQVDENGRGVLHYTMMYYPGYISDILKLDFDVMLHDKEGKSYLDITEKNVDDITEEISDIELVELYVWSNGEDYSDEAMAGIKLLIIFFLCLITMSVICIVSTIPTTEVRVRCFNGGHTSVDINEL